MTAGKISKNAGLSLCDMRSTKQSSYMADNRRFGFNALKVFLSVLKQHQNNSLKIMLIIQCLVIKLTGSFFCTMQLQREGQITVLHA